MKKVPWAQQRCHMAPDTERSGKGTRRGIVWKGVALVMMLGSSLGVCLRLRGGRRCGKTRTD